MVPAFFFSFLQKCENMIPSKLLRKDSIKKVMEVTILKIVPMAETQGNNIGETELLQDIHIFFFEFLLWHLKFFKF